MEIIVRQEVIEGKIYMVRGHKVMLDSDLAELYEVETRTLVQAVKRNMRRFSQDFMFQLNLQDVMALRSQIVTLKKGRGQHSGVPPLLQTLITITIKAPFRTCELSRFFHSLRNPIFLLPGSG